MIVQHNLLATNANRIFGLNTISQKRSTERLSSGLKINRAADDAAGLAISEKMRRQIRGLTQASHNAQDGISFCQIADGALNEVHEMLKRSEKLAIQAANGTNTSEDREYIQKEIDALTKEIDRVHTTSTFNEKRIFTDDGLPPDQAVTDRRKNLTELPIIIEMQWNFQDAFGNIVPLAEVQETGMENSYATSDMAKFIEKATAHAVGGLYDRFGSLFAKAASTGIKIGLNMTNIDGAGSIQATAALSMSSNGSSAVMSYTLNIDTSDYPMNSFDSMTDAKKADLAAVIAHEMTHLVMYDTLTDGMLGGFPDWFVEGMAQTASGDNGWVSTQISASSSDDQIKSYMNKLISMPYGAGYLGVLTLGHLSNYSTNPSSTTISEGINKLLTDMAANQHTLDQAIASCTAASSMPLTGLADFQFKFMNGDSTMLGYVKDILTSRGFGAGSLLAANLSDSELDTFGPSKLVKSGTNYTVDSTNTRFSNAFGSGYTFPDPSTSPVGGGTGFALQVGTEADNIIWVNQFSMSGASIFGGNVMDVNTVDNALLTLEYIKLADSKVSTVRSYYGATQNRLEHTVNNLNNVVENTMDAESAIRDTDMASEMVEYSNNNILIQIGQIILTQANQSKQGVLSLLG